MELPWVCTRCGGEIWIDLECLIEWPLNRLITAQGYDCEICGMREAISYTTTSLKEAERKLTRYAPSHDKFPFLFGKLVIKQIGVNQRGEILTHGESIRSDMAVP